MVRSAFFSLSIHLFYYLSLVFMHREFWTTVYAVPTSASLVTSTTGKMLAFFFKQLYFDSVLDFHQTCLCVHSCFPFRYLLVHTFLNSLAWFFLHLQNQLVFSRCCFIYFFQPHLIQLFFLQYIVSLSAYGLEL